MPPENKMGTMPVGRLLVNMSVPMVISMFVQALYNVVDSIFVARISESALTAMSLAFPLQSLMIALAVGTGVGMNALLSRSLGEGNRERAEKTAMNGVFLALMNALLFVLVACFGFGPYFRAQTDDPAILRYGTQYLSICCGASFGLFISITMDRLLQSTGRTSLSMLSQLLGTITNIVLGPVLILGWLGLPSLGVVGAAVATVIAQTAAASFGLYLNLRHNRDLRLRLVNLRPDGAIIRRIYSVGLPAIVMNSLNSLATFTFNQILLSFSTTATAVFGVYFRLQSFVFMPVFGLNSGMVPVIAYNYGAGKRDRIVGTMRLSWVAACAVMAAGTLLFQLFPASLLNLFSASADMLAIGVPALRIISLHFVLAGFTIVSVAVFQALGNGFTSLAVTVARQLIVLLPAAYLLGLSGSLSLVWFAFPIAEMSSLLVTLFFLRRTFRRVVDPLKPPIARPGAEQLEPQPV